MINEINNRFNDELEKLITGELPKGHIFRLGKPCWILQKTGVPYGQEIELSARRLKRKAKSPKHPFELNQIKDLVNAINEPLVVLSYAENSEARNIIISIEKEEEYFLVGIVFNQKKMEAKIIDIRNVFPKKTSSWLGWISEGKLLYADIEKLKGVIAQQRTNNAEVSNHALDDVESIIANNKNVKHYFPNDKNAQKSGFVAIAGRPSAGKSTFLNKVCGAKVAITSPVPQTTRNSIRGIVRRGEDELVFIDTPGLHISDKKLNLKLQSAARRSLALSDLVLYIIDTSRAPGLEEQSICALLSSSGEKSQEAGLFIALNKTDLKTSNTAAALEFIESNFDGFPKEKIFKICALSGEGCEALLDALFAAAPCGHPSYDGQCYTDQEVPFRVAEIIREQCVNLLYDELPHCVFVDASDMELRGGTLNVRAVIYCERESQKGMIVGAGGKTIGKIRIGALKTCREIFDWKIKLELRVKTAPDWRQNDAFLNRFK